MWKRIKTELVEFYKGCFNFNNIKMLFLFFLVPTIISNDINRGIRWAIFYIVALIFIWIGAKIYFKYKDNEKSKLDNR